MAMIHELPMEELWPFVRVQFDKNGYLWDLLRLDVAQFLALQKLARVAGKIPEGPAWERVPPDELGTPDISLLVWFHTISSRGRGGASAWRAGHWATIRAGKAGTRIV